MKDRWLIAFDMDGTLLGDGRVLTRRTVDALALAASKGAVLVVDSGRRFPVVPEEIRALPFMRYFVLCNGAEIYDKQQDKILFSAELSLDDALRYYDLLDEYEDVYIDCYMVDGAWARAADYARIDHFVPDQSHRDLLRRTRTPVEHLRDAVLQRGRPIYKWQAFYTDEKIRDAEFRRIREKCPGVCLTAAYPYNLEINADNVTKGGGLRKLAEILGIERERTMAFGDSVNDRSMIEYAGIGWAMENADEGTKAAADRIAPPNSADGVAQILESMFSD